MIVRRGKKGLAFFEIGTRAIRLKDFSIGVHERERNIIVYVHLQVITGT
jgi:hypothetical protein